MDIRQGVMFSFRERLDFFWPRYLAGEPIPSLQNRVLSVIFTDSTSSKLLRQWNLISSA